MYIGVYKYIFIHSYTCNHYLIYICIVNNICKMIERIQLILKTKNISASRFADEIGVQRSSISHILSGRNNPSLELVQKILKRFPDINIEWIMNGKGSMYSSPDLFSVLAEDKTAQEVVESKISDSQSDDHAEIFSEEIDNSAIDEIFQVESPEVKTNQNNPPRETKAIKTVQEKQPQNFPEIEVTIPSKTKKSIERIVIFYYDKSFSEYTPG
jgi:transcriptional regulator with XRE-family HTH domain